MTSTIISQGARIGNAVPMTTQSYGTTYPAASLGSQFGTRGYVASPTATTMGQVKYASQAPVTSSPVTYGSIGSGTFKTTSLGSGTIKQAVTKAVVTKAPMTRQAAVTQAAVVQKPTPPNQLQSVRLNKAATQTASPVKAAPVTYKAPASTAQRMPSPYALTTMPTASAVAARPQVRQKATSVDATRITVVPLKGMGKDEVMEKLNGPEMAKALTTDLVSLKQLSVFFCDNKMVVLATYPTMEALESALETNKKLFAQWADSFAGPPERYTGKADWTFKGRAKSGANDAIRVTILPLKPGSTSKSGVLELAGKAEEKLRTNPAFADVIEVISMFTDDNKGLVFSKYTSLESLQASEAAAKEVMAPMAQFMAGAPERMSGVVEFSYPNMKTTNKSKKGCC